MVQCRRPCLECSMYTYAGALGAAKRASSVDSDESGAAASNQPLELLQQRLLDWYAREKRSLPWRGSRDPYAILVSEIMLQQTQVERVVPKYLQFLAVFPTIEALAAAERSDVIRAWAPLGYNRRAVRLHELARQVVNQYGGQIPERADQLARFQGLGAYTSAAVACFAFGEQLPTLDTNVRRVLTRLFAHRLDDAGVTPRTLQTLAAEILPPGRAVEWNQALMDLGATTCRARPACERCPLVAICDLGSQEAPEAKTAVRRAAEMRASYRAEAKYHGSSRYYRGRIVDQLRALPPGRSIGLNELGAALKVDFSSNEREWLFALVRGLQADGLVRIETCSEPGSIGEIQVQLA
jgi:A/G-specific adenine glycosylase